METQKKTLSQKFLDIKLVRRFSKLNKEIKYTFTVTSISIFFIEIVFKSFPAPSDIFFRAGDLYLRICYSITASIIFYFINVHLPKENKKVKSYKHIKRLIGNLYSEIHMIYHFGLKTKINQNIEGPELDIEDLKIACERLDTKKPLIVSLGYEEIYPNWHTFALQKSGKIKDIISRILFFQEIIDGDILLDILSIQNYITNLPSWGVREGGLKNHEGSFELLFKVSLTVAKHYIPMTTIYAKEARGYYEKKLNQAEPE